MSDYYYKLFRKEAEELARRVGIVLPKTRADIGIETNKFIEDIEHYQVYLNKARTIWIQPCHYYDGSALWPKGSEPFVYEVMYGTTDSAFSRFLNKNPFPIRVFTY